MKTMRKAKVADVWCVSIRRASGWRRGGSDNRALCKLRCVVPCLSSSMQNSSPFKTAETPLIPYQGADRICVMCLRDGTLETPSCCRR